MTIINHIIHYIINFILLLLNYIINSSKYFYKWNTFIVMNTSLGNNKVQKVNFNILKNFIIKMKNKIFNYNNYPYFIIIIFNNFLYVNILILNYSIILCFFLSNIIIIIFKSMFLFILLFLIFIFFFNIILYFFNLENKSNIYNKYIYICFSNCMLFALVFLNLEDPDTLDELRDSFLKFELFDISFDKVFEKNCNKSNKIKDYHLNNENFFLKQFWRDKKPFFYYYNYNSYVENNIKECVFFEYKRSNVKNINFFYKYLYYKQMDKLKYFTDSDFQVIYSKYYHHRVYFTKFINEIDSSLPFLNTLNNKDNILYLIISNKHHSNMKYLYEQSNLYKYRYNQWWNPKVNIWDGHPIYLVYENYSELLLKEHEDAKLKALINIMELNSRRLIKLNSLLMDIEALYLKSNDYNDYILNRLYNKCFNGIVFNRKFNLAYYNDIIYILNKKILDHKNDTDCPLYNGEWSMTFRYNHIIYNEDFYKVKILQINE